MSSERMQYHDLANKYAVAFLNSFGDSLRETDADLLLEAHEFFKSRRQACFLMQLSALTESLKIKLMKSVRIKLGLSVSFDTIMCLLVEHKRSFLLEYFFKSLFREIEKRNNQTMFVVESAGKLTSEHKKKIIQFLEKVTGKTVKCTYHQNSKLIAGLRLKNDTFLWENSVRNRLNRIRSSLKR